jgi:hypothetical protein
MRMLAWALVLPFLKHLVSIDGLTALAWRGPRCVGRTINRERRIAELAHLMHRSRRPIGRYNCLERSLIAYRFLSEVNADPRLVLGLRKGDGSIEGHSWVLVDGKPVRESIEALVDFEPVVAFGRHGARQEAPSFDLDRRRLNRSPE